VPIAADHQIVIEQILSHPAVYRAWQAPFVEQKLAPFLENSSISPNDRVLDVGCGPGTNAGVFAPTGYVGADLSSDYIESARKRFPLHRFEVWDITKPGPSLGKFDVALINSVFHHLSDDETVTVLGALHDFLENGATIHIIDLVLPPERSLARSLAKLDRGEFPRSIEHWQSLFGSLMDVTMLKPFRVGLFGTRMWDMVYVRGAAR
jgi:SAM-dependent methyltransferase